MSDLTDTEEITAFDFPGQVTMHPEHEIEKNTSTTTSCKAHAKKGSMKHPSHIRFKREKSDAVRTFSVEDHGSEKWHECLREAVMYQLGWVIDTAVVTEWIYSHSLVMC